MKKTLIALVLTLTFTPLAFAKLPEVVEPRMDKSRAVLQSIDRIKANLTNASRDGEVSRDATLDAHNICSEARGQIRSQAAKREYVVEVGTALWKGCYDAYRAVR